MGKDIEMKKVNQFVFDLVFINSRDLIFTY